MPNNIVFERELPPEEAFLHLPPGYNSRALRAYKRAGISNKSRECMSTSLEFGFSWVVTEEGQDFWYNVYKYYIDGADALPPLPKED